MKVTRILWDMPITVAVNDKIADKSAIDDVYKYFEHIDQVFSTYKENSEISRINRKELTGDKWSREMMLVLALCEQTKQETNGFFEYRREGRLDPLGVVKGWAVYNAAARLKKLGFDNYYINAGGDCQVSGANEKGEPWKIGIRNPFNLKETVKRIGLKQGGVATSGTYIRGDHIINYVDERQSMKEIVSLTVIAPDVCEADRMATAAFAMGEAGIGFIEKLPGFEGYLIKKDQTAIYTSGFDSYVAA